MIFSAPIAGSSNELADWMELEVLTCARGEAPLGAVNESLEIAEDNEPSELDHENLANERRLQQVIAAVEERRKVIGAAYPFACDKAGTLLRLADPLTDAAYVYLFCLIVSAGAPDGILQENGPWKPDLDTARGIFQICATVASAGHVGGPAYSVGWPRSDSSGFLEKLRTVYAHFGDGKVHAAIPPGAPAQVKDDEIDVIAWKADDVRPRLGYFLGQAASGNNWPAKSLKGHVDTYHGTWFLQSPACLARVGTIIPFYLPSDADAEDEDHEAQEIIEGKLRRLGFDFPELLHRHRVARYFESGLVLHAKGVSPIEGVAETQRIRTFVDKFRAQLQAAAAQA